jgi:predicted nucleic acid-binding protein
MGDPVAFTASTLNEISYGLHKVASAGVQAADAQLRWLRDQIAAGLIDVLAFERRAADVAGALRARMPTPPAAAKRSERRSKAEGRVAWMMDLQCAATVFVHGYDLLSADSHHSVIATALSALAPAAPPLLVEAPPEF